MKGYKHNIEELTKKNENFRKVLYTAAHSQLVLMSLKPDEGIGEEVHDVDQFLRFESGMGKAIMDGVEHALRDGDAIVIPAGMKHNIINTSSETYLKLYTLYSPPHHKDGLVHATKGDAEKDKEDHFRGDTTEDVI